MRVRVGALVLFLAACGSTASAPSTTLTSTEPAATSTSALPTLTSAGTTTPPTTAVAAPSTTTAGFVWDNWPTFGASTSRRGVTSAGLTDPAVAKVAWRSPKLNGLLYGQPLVVGRSIIVATEGDDVVALDRTDGHVLWTTHLGTPVSGSSLPCGNIDPSGVTGTPTVDLSTGTLYVVAFVNPGHHDLVALDVETGTVKWRTPFDPPGLSPLVEQERSALTIANGRVYVSFGGLYGDCGQYKGAVGSIALDGTGEQAWWTVPTKRMGGVWAPSGLAVDGTDVIAATGNAASSSSSNFDYGNAVVRLDANLTLTDYWAPSDWAELSAADRDLGSIGPLVVGDQVVVAGKDGKVYFLSRQAFGHIGGQQRTVAACAGAFGGLAADDAGVVVACTDGPHRVRFDQAEPAWHGPKGRTGAPVISGNTVWVEQNAGHVLALALDSGKVLADINLGGRVEGFPSPSVMRDGVYAVFGSQVVAIHG
jgi:outer membrane protein assembly factor BamB